MLLSFRADIFLKKLRKICYKDFDSYDD